MAGTKWRQILRGCFGQIHRELKISFTPIPRPNKWVFIVGCYNSGTTLLSEVLSSHHSISGLPTEGQYLTDEIAADHELGLSRMWVRREDLYRLTEADDGPNVTRIKKEWGMRLDLSKSILLEKSPPNSARTRWLQKHFENSHFIAIIRNGYAVTEGICRKAQPIHLADGWPIEMSAYQWKRCNEVLEKDSKFLKHFMWVKYEDFTENPKGVLTDIVKYLGLKDLKGVDLSRKWTIHEKKQPIKNLNKENIRNLSSEDIKAINKVTEGALVHFGYDVLHERLA